MRSFAKMPTGSQWWLPAGFAVGALTVFALRVPFANFSFLLLAPLAVLCVLSLLKKPTPILFLATALAVFGVLGSYLWEWGRHGQYRWSGLPLTYGLSTADVSRTRLLFFISAVTCFAAGLLLPHRARKRDLWPSTALVDLPKLSRSAVPLNLLVLAFYLVGQGTSLLERDVYLQSNGVDWLLRVAVGLLVPILTVNFLLILAPIPQARRIAILFLQVLWSLVLASAGTRIAIIALVLLAAGILISSRGPARIVGFVVSTAAAMASMTWVHTARESTHGLDPLMADILSGHLLATLQPDSLVTSFRGMAASVGAAFPITAMSADRPLPLSAIWTLANPFPRDLLSGGSVDVATRDFGVLAPLTWVPRSTIGMMWAGGGWWLLAAAWAVTCAALWLADRWLSMVPYGRTASYGFALLIFFGSLQYGVRQQMRVLTIAVALGAIGWTQRHRFKPGDGVAEARTPIVSSSTTIS